MLAQRKSCYQEKPQTYLQKAPPNISAVILIVIILGVFNIGTFSEEIISQFETLRIIGLVVFVIFSWLQVWSFKSLGKNYSQEILILKEHELYTKGPYRYIRHPQYISQFLSDLCAGIALCSYIAVPLVLLFELPLFILRAKEEEKLLYKHFEEEFSGYKSKSGFIFPFIG